MPCSDRLACLPTMRPAGAPGALLAEAVRAAMQLHCEAGRPAAALAHLEQQLPALRSAHVPHSDMEGLWAAAVAGAAASQDAHLLQQAMASAQAWATEADDDSPAFQARLLGLQAAASLATQQAQQSARQYSRAVHVCPGSEEARLGLAAAVLVRPGSGQREAEAALCLLDSPAVAAAVARGKRAVRVAPSGKVGCVKRAVLWLSMEEQDQNRAGPFACQGSYAAIDPGHLSCPNCAVQPAQEAAVEAGTAAVLAARHCTSEQLRRRLSAAARCVHESPGNARLWRLAAITAKRVAAADAGSDEAAGLRAWRWCRAAESAALPTVAVF